MSRDAAQLLLDRLQCLARLQPHLCFQQYWKRVGKPANRTRDVYVSEKIFAPVPFNFDQDRLFSGPIRQGVKQGGQQHVIHSSLVSTRDVLQQRLRLAGVKRDRKRSCLGLEVAAITQIDRERLNSGGRQAGPVSQLVASFVRTCVLFQQFRPTRERGGLRRESGGFTALQLLIDTTQIFQQDSP